MIHYKINLLILTSVVFFTFILTIEGGIFEMITRVCGSKYHTYSIHTYYFMIRSHKAVIILLRLRRFACTYYNVLKEASS